MSCSEAASPSVGHERSRDAGADESALEAFLLDVAEVARSVDPSLVEILSVAREPASAGRPWTGNRRRGLELCLNMLRYARVEVARGEESRRVDLGIGYITEELARLDHAAGIKTPH